MKRILEIYNGYEIPTDDGRLLVVNNSGPGDILCDVLRPDYDNVTGDEFCGIDLLGSDEILYLVNNATGERYDTVEFVS